MLTTRIATVTALLRVDSGIVHLEALADGETSPRAAVAYPDLTGAVGVGDRVTLNTTATGLKLGTGGVDFVVANATRAEMGQTFGSATGDEHIMKLRYTPQQFAVRAIEREPAYAEIAEAAMLDGTPVVVCGLHSQIAPVVGGIKAARLDARVAYVMTDGAALPLSFSRLVRDLKAARLIDATLTFGQAFGGDYECVTHASALLAARHVAGADAIVVAQGPGNAGTGTAYGFSGLEQGPLLDIAARLGGVAIGVLRLSLADRRARHRGLSHHTRTAIGQFAGERCRVALPTCPDVVSVEEYADVCEQVRQSALAARHDIETIDGGAGLALLTERGIRPRSMGRGLEEDPLFFHAAAAAGALAFFANFVP